MIHLTSGRDMREMEEETERQGAGDGAQQGLVPGPGSLRRLGSRDSCPSLESNV